MKALNAQDRCDRCQAQAYVVTVHSGNSMMWCSHHYEKYKVYLEPALIHDEREELLNRT